MLISLRESIYNSGCNDMNGVSYLKDTIKVENKFEYIVLRNGKKVKLVYVYEEKGSDLIKYGTNIKTINFERIVYDANGTELIIHKLKNNNKYIFDSIQYNGKEYRPEPEE